ncbi:MAG: hypothetical protein AABX17_01740 [Nanoarchaeota archaeon]
MKKIVIEWLLKFARDFKENGTNWHHHFLTPKCYLNKSGKFQIILENEDTGEVYYSEFQSRPMDKLEQLEKLFFNH